MQEMGWMQRYWTRIFFIFCHIWWYFKVLLRLQQAPALSKIIKNVKKTLGNCVQRSTHYFIYSLGFFFFLIWYSRNLYFTMHNYPLGVYYLSSGSKCSIQKDALVTNENPSLPDWFQIGPIQLLVYPFTK